MGAHSGTVTLTVHWPDGQVERIPNLAVDRRYALQQSAGAQLLPPQTADQLRPQNVVVAEDNATARSFMPVPVPLPQLTYDSAQGLRNVSSGDSAVLLTLWSASCTTCLTELREWSREYDRFSAADIEVLALNVDPWLEPAGAPAVDEASLRDRAEELFRQLDLPFQRGFATRDLMNRIEALQLHLFDNSHPLLLPCSLLIDKNGALGAFYRGATPRDQITADGQALLSKSAERVAYALPFSGRWRARLGSPNVSVIGSAFARAGYPDDLLEVYQAALRGEPQNLEMRHEFADQLQDRGQLRAALDERKRIAQFGPADIRNWLQRSAIELELGEIPAALASLRHVTDLEPAHLAANLRLGQCYLMLAQYERAAAA